MKSLKWWMLPVLLVLMSCGDKENRADAGGSAAEVPYEVNFLYMAAAEGPNQGKVQEAVNALALKEFNMKVRLIPMTFGSYFGQISLMPAANEPLDLFPAFSNNFSTYIESH
jgi:putative aldouronate transport system substrate-binding protein